MTGGPALHEEICRRTLVVQDICGREGGGRREDRIRSHLERWRSGGQNRNKAELETGWRTSEEQLDVLEGHLEEDLSYVGSWREGGRGDPERTRTNHDGHETVLEPSRC